jgi:hypothetical protein
MKYKTQPVNFIEHIIEKITDDAEFIAPDPKMPLAQAIPMFMSAYFEGRKSGLPQDKLDMLQTWMVTADAIIRQEQARLQQEQMQQMQAAQMQGAPQEVPPQQ